MGQIYVPQQLRESLRIKNFGQSIAEVMTDSSVEKDDQTPKFQEKNAAFVGFNLGSP